MIIDVEFTVGVNYLEVLNVRPNAQFNADWIQNLKWCYVKMLNGGSSLKVSVETAEFCRQEALASLFLRCPVADDFQLTQTWRMTIPNLASRPTRVYIMPAIFAGAAKWSLEEFKAIYNSLGWDQSDGVQRNLN
jgi:hypothetical protein